MKYFVIITLMLQTQCFSQSFSLRDEVINFIDEAKCIEIDEACFFVFIEGFINENDTIINMELIYKSDLVFYDWANFIGKLNGFDILIGRSPILNEFTLDLEVVGKISECEHFEFSDLLVKDGDTIFLIFEEFPKVADFSYIYESDTITIFYKRSCGLDEYRRVIDSALVDDWSLGFR